MEVFHFRFHKGKANSKFHFLKMIWNITKFSIIVKQSYIIKYNKYQQEVILITSFSVGMGVANWVKLLTSSSNSPTTEGTISGSILVQLMSLVTLTLYTSSGSQKTTQDISSWSAAIDLNLQICIYTRTKKLSNIFSLQESLWYLKFCY